MDRRVRDRISNEVIQAYLPENNALYSVWMPGDPTTAVITVVIERLRRAYTDTIEDDNVAEACAIYLIESGAPVFTDVAKHNAYCKAFEDGLRAALTPEDAREAALQAVGMGGSGKMR